MKKTININNKLDERIKEYIAKYDMTYTVFLNLASERYLESIDKAKDFEKIFMDMFNNVKITTNENK